MTVDLTTNINIRKSLEKLESNNISSSTNFTAKPIRNNSGITNISDIDKNLKAFFSTTKPILQAPRISLEDIASQEVNIPSTMQAMLNLETAQPKLPEFISACIDKIKNDIKNLPVDKKSKQTGWTIPQVDNDNLSFLCILLTIGSKSQLVNILKQTLHANIKTREAENQSYIDKNTEVQKISTDKQNKQAKIKANQKRWGIVGSALSIIASIASTVLTVATFGATAPLAILAYSACAATVVGCTCTISGLATGNETLSKLGQWFGIAGSVLSLVGGIANFFGKAIETASNVLQFTSVIAGCASGITNSGSQIINSCHQRDLAKLEKELSQMKISLEKIDQKIKLLSNFIEVISNGIKQAMKDVFKNEEESARMIQQMFDTALSIEKNVKC
jgi:hypothetical protein